METERETDVFRFETMLPAERARLVRLCAYLSGEPDAAEDLAQETLFEAWRHVERLTDVSGSDRWLGAIAANVCRRWRRRRGREHVHYVGSTQQDLDDVPAADGDLEVELARDELARLLDRAMELLPDSTRALLVERYLEEQPLPVVAERRGISEATLAVRLHRGKMALRRLLVTNFHEEALTYGLVRPEAAGWQATRLWCPTCGQRHLEGRLDLGNGEFGLRCSVCSIQPKISTANNRPEHFAVVFGRVKGFRPALTRLMNWTTAYLRPIAQAALPCAGCGHAAAIWLAPAADIEQRADEPDIAVRCGRCGWVFHCSFAGLALAQPEGQGFWRSHARIRALPTRTIEAGGRPALLTTFESLTASARLDVVTARDSLECLDISH